jgi:basic amino acid/polyamine antiporter, APA family
VSQPPAESHAAAGLPADLARPKLSLLDATCIMVGIIIGATIYESSPLIARGAASGMLGAVAALRGSDATPLSEATRELLGTVAVIGVWAIGGLAALLGSLCYAELSTAFPHEGGNYYFLKQAFGSSVAFAFAWVEFWIIRPGNVGAVAFVFARYAARLAPGIPWLQTPAGQMLLAAAAIVTLTGINLAGIRTGAWTQNILTASKVLGLAAIVVIAATLLGREPAAMPLPSGAQPGFGLALILVMFAYGGWSDMSYVAADVRNPQRNISRSLLLGAAGITLIYVLLTAAFIAALSLPGLIESSAVATDVVSLRLGRFGAVAISLLICVSTLGAINGMLFAGGRVFYALGKEDAAFAWLGAWNERFGGPVRSLLVQAGATLGLVVAFGLYAEGFKRLVVFTGPFFWGFLLLIGIGFFILRSRGTLGRGGYRVPLYPLPPLLLCAACLLMTYAAADYAVKNWASEGYWAVAVVVSGLVLLAARAASLLWSRSSRGC